MKTLFVKLKKFKHIIGHDIKCKKGFTKNKKNLFRIKMSNNISEENIRINGKIGSQKDMIRNQNKAKFITYLIVLRVNYYHKKEDKQKEIIRNEFKNMSAFV